MTDERKTDFHSIFGLGVNPQNAVQDMKFVQDLYFWSSLFHPYIQVIFSFDAGVSFDTPALREICMEIGHCLVLDERQVLGAIHYKNTDKVHCHYMINYVSVTGNLYRQQYSVIFYKKQVNQVLFKYGLNGIEFYGMQQQEKIG